MIRPKLKAIPFIVVLLLCLLGRAHAETLAAGFQVVHRSSGLSLKYRMSDAFTAQGIAGFFGSVNSYTARGLLAFNSGPFYDIYAYGSVGLWRWSGNRFFRSESAFGVGAGVGFEYDMRGLAPELPPFFASAELGASFANFDNFSGFSTLGVGLALHYRF